MKNKILLLGLFTTLLLSAGTFANAQILTSVSFQGGDTVALAPGDITGAPGYSGGNWNNATGASGGPLTLNDSTSTSSTSAVSLTTYSAGPFGVNGPDNSNTTPQETLFSGSLGVNYGPASFTLSGLSAYGTYDLVVYYTGGTSFSSGRNADITASGSGLTYYIAGNDNLYTSWIQSNSTTAGTFDSGNYIVFSGLTSSSEVVTMENSNNNMGLVGFQVLGTVATVPEPSTWGMLFGGLALLVRVRHFRNRTT